MPGEMPGEMTEEALHEFVAVKTAIADSVRGHFGEHIDGLLTQIIKGELTRKMPEIVRDPKYDVRVWTPGDGSNSILFDVRMRTDGVDREVKFTVN